MIAEQIRAVLATVIVDRQRIVDVGNAIDAPVEVREINGANLKAAQDAAAAFAQFESSHARLLSMAQASLDNWRQERATLIECYCTRRAEDGTPDEASLCVPEGDPARELLAQIGELIRETEAVIEQAQQSTETQ